MTRIHAFLVMVCVLLCLSPGKRITHGGAPNLAASTTATHAVRFEENDSGRNAFGSGEELWRCSVRWQRWAHGGLARGARRFAAKASAEGLVERLMARTHAALLSVASRASNGSGIDHTRHECSLEHGEA